MRVRARIHDVAHAAGVSVTTVSQALNGRGKVSARTRERVQQVADELGYAPSRIATALQSQRTGIVGFVADEIATTPFAGRIVRGAQDEAAALGLTLMVVDSGGDEAVERRQIEVLRAQQVDAFVYARMYNQVHATPTAAIEPLPLATVNVSNPEGRVPSVQPDEFAIGATATRLLLDAGHRRIAHVTIRDPGPAVELRTAGYTDAMRRAGLEPHAAVVEGPADSIAGRRAFAAVLEAAPLTTAVFAFNDPMAMGVYQTAFAHGLRVPDHVSVVGVDNLDIIAAQLEPALTTLELPHAAMGAWAVRAVAGPKGERPEHALLGAPIIRRASVAPAV